MNNFKSTHKMLKKQSLEALSWVKKEESDENLKKFKRSFFDYMYSCYEVHKSDSTLQKDLEAFQLDIGSIDIELLDIFNVNSYKNLSNSIIINYNVEKFRSCNDKTQKDIYFSQIYNLVEDFVVRTAKKLNFNNYNEDLVSAGFIGVFNAVNDTFDPLQGGFLTHAFHKIRSEIQKEKTHQYNGVKVPSIHEHFNKVYADTFREQKKEEAAELEYDENIIDITLLKLKENNYTITKEGLKNVIQFRLNKVYSLDAKVGDEDGVDLIETIADTGGFDLVAEKLDNELLNQHIRKWLDNYTDFEKAILEKKFGLNLGNSSRYTVYTIKVERDGKHSHKDMIAMKASDAMKRVESLGYSILSTIAEIEESKQYKYITDSTGEELRKYFEVVKLTKLSANAIKKNEESIMEDLTDYLKRFYEGKKFDFPGVKFTS